MMPGEAPEEGVRADGIPLLVNEGERNGGAAHLPRHRKRVRVRVVEPQHNVTALEFVVPGLLDDEDRVPCPSSFAVGRALPPENVTRLEVEEVRGVRHSCPG
eukprot:693533-Rhodomonas_salina.1